MLNIDDNANNNRWCINAQDATITLNDVTLSFTRFAKRAYISAAGTTKVYLNNCNLGDPRSDLAPISKSANSEIIIAGGTFGFNPLSYGATLAEGYYLHAPNTAYNSTNLYVVNKQIPATE